MAERPLTGPQLRAALAAQFPEANAAALAYACRNRLALVQVPPRGLWGRSAAVTTTTAEAWLGQPLEPRAVAGGRDRPLPRGLRPGERRRRHGVVPADRPARRRRGPAPTAPRLPRRARAGAVRPARTHRGPTPARRRRRASSRSTTTRCSRTPTAAASTSIARGSRPCAGRCRGPCSRTASCAASGTSSAQQDGASVTLVVEHVVKLTKRAAAAIAAEGERSLRFAAAGATARDVRLVAAAVSRVRRRGASRGRRRGARAGTRSGRRAPRSR